MRSCAGICFERGELYFVAAARVREALYFEQCAGRAALAEETVSHGGKIREICGVGEIGLRADDIGEAHVGLGQNGSKQAENKLGLLSSVVRRDDIAIGVERELARDEKQCGRSEIDADCGRVGAARSGLAGGRNKRFFHSEWIAGAEAKGLTGKVDIFPGLSSPSGSTECFKAWRAAVPSGVVAVR